MFTDARAVKKEIAGKDSLIQQANEELTKQKDALTEKDTQISELQTEREQLIEKNGKLEELIKKNFFERIFATSLWS